MIILHHENYLDSGLFCGGRNIFNFLVDFDFDLELAWKDCQLSTRFCRDSCKKFWQINKFEHNVIRTAKNARIVASFPVSQVAISEYSILMRSNETKTSLWVQWCSWTTSWLRKKLFSWQFYCHQNRYVLDLSGLQW